MGLNIFFLAEACLSFKLISIYLSVILLELCPASSRTCSLGRILISSEMPVCRNQCTVACDSSCASSSNFFLRNVKIASSKQSCIIFRIWLVSVTALLPRMAGINGALSFGKGKVGDNFKCARQRLSADNIDGLAAICRSLLSFPAVVNHQFL